ncbi:MAG TPA: hypothetical protein O0X18_01070, partial [Methanocorpusculum sp.]|nr:hypothetical protein [Methanocorpusculum sp.]
MKISISPFFQDIAGELVVSGIPEKGNADNADASLRSASFARRICFSSLAIPPRTGRAALLSQARRQMLAKLPLIPYP